MPAHKLTILRVPPSKLRPFDARSERLVKRGRGGASHRRPSTAGRLPRLGDLCLGEAQGRAVIKETVLTVGELKRILLDERLGGGRAHVTVVSACDARFEWIVMRAGGACEEIGGPEKERGADGRAVGAAGRAGASAEASAAARAARAASRAAARAAVTAAAVMVGLIGLAAAERAGGTTSAEMVEATAAAMAAGMASAMWRRGWQWRRGGGEGGGDATASAKVSKRMAVAKVAVPASGTTAAVL